MLQISPPYNPKYNKCLKTLSSFEMIFKEVLPLVFAGPEEGEPPAAPPAGGTQCSLIYKASTSKPMNF